MDSRDAPPADIPSDAPQGPAFPWEELPDEELLRWRIADLKVRIDGSVLEGRVQRLYEELAAKGLRFKPPCYLATEWLTPDLIPAVGIPFYLAHPRLTKLERTLMLEAEGEAEAESMKLLRHETGHAINYAYRLYRRTRWRDLFGSMSTEYDPHGYMMRPYSKQYVVHLRDNYAQAHPDEDFAETFAVWMTPGISWQGRYQGWGALRKLEYVDYLMREIAERPPLVKGGPRYYAANRARATLDTYFKTKRRAFGGGYLGFYDPILLKLFAAGDGRPAALRADRFLAAHRKALVNCIAHWSRIPKYSVDQLIRRLSQRAREMGLSLHGEAEPTLVSVGVCINSLLLVERYNYESRRSRS
jgi:hypothetical protein